MTAVTVTASATEDQSVFWRPSAALQVAHKPTKKRSLAASLLAAISALTLLLGLAGPASASTAPDSETAVAAQTDPTQAFVAAGGLETPATVRPNGSFGYDGVLGCCVAPTSAVDDFLGVACRGNSFVPGTGVLMADGTTKPIEEVEIGEWVWAHDPETGEIGPRRVIDTILGDGQKHLVEIEVLGDTMTATDGHPFWVDDQGRWVDAGDLDSGDRLLLADGSTAAVLAVVDRVAVMEVHNLAVEGLHTYYVEAGDEHVLSLTTRIVFQGPG